MKNMYGGRVIAALICFMVSLFSFVTHGNSLDVVRMVAEDGKPEQALTMLDTISGDTKSIEMLRGELLWSIGRDTEAVEALKRVGTTESKLKLAEIAINTYNTADAATILNALKPKASKNRKAAEPSPEIQELEERASRIDEMLTRVEAIQIIDSVNVPFDNFFKYYKLSSESGKLMGNDILPESFESVDNSVVFIPQSRRTMIWSAPDASGMSRLVWADALYADTWDTPAPLSEILADEDADAMYPFMMPDGITLYYAADNDDSLGGYDIYMSRRTDDGFLEPVNLGMPYNSPYNDYMMAIDETTGVGWFATDRNRVPGKVTIYTFIPAEMRINVAAEDPDIAAKALLRPISATRAPQSDIASARRRISEIAKAGDTSHHNDFEIYIPGRGVVYSYAQLPTPGAREAAKRYVAELKSRNEIAAQLAECRALYGRHKGSSLAEIRKLEKDLKKADDDLIHLRNLVVEASE